MAFKPMDMEKINQITIWSKKKPVIYTEASKTVKERSKEMVDIIVNEPNISSITDKLYLTPSAIYYRRNAKSFHVSVELMAPIAEGYGSELDSTFNSTCSLHQFWSGHPAQDYQLPNDLNLYVNMLVDMNDASRVAARKLVHSYAKVEPSKVDTALITKERIRERIEQDGFPEQNRNKYSINAATRNLAETIDSITGSTQLPYAAEMEELSAKNAEKENASVLTVSATSILAMAIMSEMPLDYYVSRDYITRTADCAQYKDANGQLNHIADKPWLVQDCVDYLMLNRDDQAKLIPQVVEVYMA